MPAEDGFQKVSHVLFDMDGTLVGKVVPRIKKLLENDDIYGVKIFLDSEKAYTEAATKVVSELGHQFTDDIKQRVVGRPSRVLARTVIDEFKLAISEQELVERYEAESAQLLENVRLMPGVERLLIHLHNERIPMAIATSSTQQSYKHKCQLHCNLFSVMHHIVCGNDSELKHGKPAADIYLLAASRFPRPVEPHCCLVIEDSPSGMKAGVAAGMQVVMIPDSNVPPELTIGATQVLRSMECFRPEQFGLPPYDCEEQFTFG